MDKWSCVAICKWLIRPILEIICIALNYSDDIKVNYIFISQCVLPTLENSMLCMSFASNCVS